VSTNTPIRQTVVIELNLAPTFERDEDGDLVPSDPTDYDAQILDAIVTKLMKRYDYAASADLMKKVDDKISGVVAARIKEIIEQPIQRYEGHTRWGEDPQPVGEPFVLVEEVKRSVAKLVAAPPSDQSVSSWNRAPRNMGDLVAETVDSLLRKELAPTIAAAKKTINDEVVRTAQAAVAAALTPKVK
jgi:hypothetical protein